MSTKIRPGERPPIPAPGSLQPSQDEGVSHRAISPIASDGDGERQSWALRHPWGLPGLFLAARLLLLLTLPQEGIVGYGDYWNFFRLAGLGRPFLDFWVEFPPVFPYLSRILFQIVGGREHAYQYALALFLSVVQAGNLALFLKLAGIWHPGPQIRQRGWVYALVLVGFGYGWWYFDPIAVMGMLLALHWTIHGQDGKAGLALAFGILTKWFPALALAAVWKLRPTRPAIRTTVISLVLPAIVYGLFWAASPELTLASLKSQGGKGSWETIWALVDGNLTTGNFSPEAARTDPATASIPVGNPAKVPPWLTLAAFGGLGLGLYARSGRGGPRSALAFLGIAWCLFLLWSPGYSPQWVLYLLPLILLVLPDRLGIMMVFVFVLVNLLEWPVLLSRGYFQSLWVIIPLRTVLVALLGFEFWRLVRVGSLEAAP